MTITLHVLNKKGYQYITSYSSFGLHILMLAIEFDDSE